MDHPRAGLQYPRSLGEFQAWFSTDDACLDYLELLRWPNGFVCPLCDSAGGWYTGDGRWMCTACGHRTSVTAGTIFHRTRTPLTVWFAACWAFASAKDGISALSLQRTLEIGSYETAWTMLHRLRSVLVRPGRERLTGIVEVDETFIGGEEQGLKGGRAKGKKVLVGVAIEVKEPKGFGRCRLAVLNDGSSASLHPFVIAAVEPGAMVITDAWQGYRGIERLGYSHEPRSQRAARARGEDSGSLLPGVHRLASLVKRWLLGTHQGAVTPEHLESYLNVLLSSVEASATSGGTDDRQSRTGSLEVTVTPGTYVRVHGVLGSADDLSSRRSRGLDRCRRALPRGSARVAVPAAARRRRGPFGWNGTHLRGAPCALPHVGDDNRDRAMRPDAGAAGLLCPMAGACASS